MCLAFALVYNSAVQWVRLPALQRLTMILSGMFTLIDCNSHSCCQSEAVSVPRSSLMAFLLILPSWYTVNPSLTKGDITAMQDSMLTCH